MENFLKKVIEGNGIRPTKVCTEAFNDNFRNAINVDWSQKGTDYEAVFYLDNIEHIAVFDMTGGLVKYKMYLTDKFLPVLIKENIEAKGEIMNVVCINERNSISYEVIIRDSELKRYLILINQLGKIISERIL